MKGSVLIGNSLWLFLCAQFAVVQSALGVPLALSSQPEQLDRPASLQQQSNLLGQRRNRPVLRRTKVKPIVSPAESNPVIPPAPKVGADEWAVTALQSLSERYGCAAPPAQGMTRSEFATILSSCIVKMEEAVAERAVGTVKEDIATLQSLQQEFASELATLIIRIDEKADKSKQFSTTTKLVGEVVFVAADTFGDRTSTSGDPTVPVFGYRARLNFDTSFMGKDQLRIRVQARDVPQFSGATSTGTNMTRLAVDGSSTSAFSVDDFFYKFPVGDNTTAWVIANGYGTNNLAPTLSPTASSGTGAISRLGRFSPIYRLTDGPGVALQHKFSDEVNLSLSYRARNATNQTPGNGLFNGNYGAFAQLTVKPSQNFDVGVQYANAYFPAGTPAVAGTATTPFIPAVSSANAAGTTGSAFAQQPFVTGTATQTNTYGVVSSYRLSPGFNISGWAGLTEARGQGGPNAGQSASVSNWMVTLGFPDLGQKGNFGALMVGMPPKATSNDNVARRDLGTSTHIEAYYLHRLTDNIAITPGILVITNPNHNSANPTQVVGVIRSTLSF
jgi:Carbohydrate-selective porin, OprB family